MEKNPQTSCFPFLTQHSMLQEQLLQSSTLFTLLNFLFLNGREGFLQESVAWCGLIAVHQLRGKGLLSDVSQLGLTSAAITNYVGLGR